MVHFLQYGEIRSITMASKGTCAFIQFAKRASAEVAAEQTFNKLVRNKFTSAGQIWRFVAILATF